MPSIDDRRGTPREAEDDATRVAPGAISALLAQLARPPEGSSWAVVLRRGGVIGRFELVREIGRGGFGVVWEALDRELGRAVAFKAVRLPAPAAMPDERRLREAELAARLSHPNIVTLHDVGRGQTRATKQGVYHYEVAFTIESKVFALFGCPSAEVRK